MGKIVIISNRLPTTVKKDTNGQLQYNESIGGLATGLKTFHTQANSLWIGCPGWNIAVLFKRASARKILLN